MSYKKSSILNTDKLGSRFLYFVIVAIAITNFIVRLKVFPNVKLYSMTKTATMSNFITYYKLVWVLLISLVLISYTAFMMYKYKKKLEVNFVTLGVGLVILAAIISFLLAPLGEVTIWGLYSRNNGLLAYTSLFLLIYLISSLKVQDKHISFLVNIINIVSLVLITIGIFQFFGMDMMNSTWFKQIYTPSEYKHLIAKIHIAQPTFPHDEHYLASSVFGQFNYFGAYCSIIFPFITAFALKESNMTKKAPLIIGSIMLFTGTILAQSMGSIITMLAVLLAIPVFLVDRSNYKSFLVMLTSYTIMSAAINRLTDWWAFREIYRYIIQIMNSKLSIVLMLMLLLYICLFLLRKKFNKYRYMIVSIVIVLVILIGAAGYIYTINYKAEFNMDMLSNRGYIWHYSNEIVKENFVFGIGPDNLYYHFPQKNENQDIYLEDTIIDKPHNMYLQVLLDTGIFGLIGFMIILTGILLRSNKAIDMEKEVYKNTYLKALMLVVIAYMIQGMVNDNHLTIQPVIFMIIGIGASLIWQTLGKVKAFAVKK